MVPIRVSGDISGDRKINLKVISKMGKNRGKKAFLLYTFFHILVFFYSL